MVEIPNLDLFLTAADVPAETEAEFIDEGKVVPKEETGFDSNTFDITIKLPNGAKRVWTMNKTSQRAVARHYGTDSKAWIGRKVVLHTSEQNVRGEMKKVIYVKRVLT